MRAAMIDELPMRQSLPVRISEEIPEMHERQKIRSLVLEPMMRLVGRAPLVERTLTRIGHRQRRRDHQHLGEHTFVATAQDHPPDTRIERQSRKLASERRQRAIERDGAQLLQQLIAIGDCARRRRLEERKLSDLADSQARHPQDHRGQ